MKNSLLLGKLKKAAERGRAVSARTALAILRSPGEDFPEIMASAWRMRQRYHKGKLHLCSILNAKSGACPEDCAFCAQSAHHRAGVEVYDLRAADAITEARDKAAKLPISRFGIVTSGPAAAREEVGRICEVVRRSKKSGVAWCASLGALGIRELRLLKSAGLKRFHHNLETAESFFPRICSTHTYAGRLKTIRAVKTAGLEVCSGGILGMGESLEQRVDLAVALGREKVDSIPLNFLIPLKGTRLENMEPMKPLDILRCVAMFRMTNPRAEIKVCAGRLHLRDLQSMIFYAGATGMMVGDLLTVAGRDVKQDLRMIEDLEV